MKRETWHRIRDLLDEAWATSPEKRAAFLDEACGGDPVLRAELEALLAAEAGAGSLLEVPMDALIGGLLGEVMDERPTPRPARLSGQQIGSYRLLREVGRGGMGSVYLAQRADGHFEQDVAVKLLRRGLDSDDIVRRFLSERQILASLQHPGIARLFDGGITDQGQPFFVMEFVPGLPLVDYCDAHHLPVERRLGLFRDVGKAVQYAHQNLVVHRDLKPSNILVTDDGEVKLLDFGIAKLLDEKRAAGAPPPTRTGQRWMTPEYAAPEQIKAEPVTTATDVYQLCVVLYELLTGRHPFERRGRTLFQIEQAVLGEEPAKPSTAVGRVTERLAPDDTGPPDALAVSRARATQPNRLRRMLQGDLDMIVLKGLRKEPDARYASAEALVDDIERYLAGLPVAARRGTRGYRVRKFVRRHRWGVAAAAIVTVSLVAGIAGTAWQARVATAGWDQAQLEAEKSAQVTEFLMSLFEAGDPSAALGDTLTVYDLLGRGVVRAEALADEPLVQAQMLDVIGRVYHGLGEYVAAQPLFERALAQRRHALGRWHPDVAESLDQLAALLESTGDYELAAPLVREALAMRRELLGEEHLDVAASLNSLATLLQAKGEYDEAEALFRDVLTRRQRLLGETHFDAVTSMNNLALLLHLKGAYAEAEVLFRRVVAIDRETLGEMHPDMATDMHNLAVLLTDVGKYDEAETLYQEVLAMHRKILGDEHPMVATDLSGLATLLATRGRYGEAEAYVRQAWAIDRVKRGDTHPYTITDQAHLAVLRHRQGDLDGAESMLRSAEEMFREQLGTAHPRIARTLVSLADVLTDQADYETAERLYREALVMQQDLLQPEHLDLAVTQHGMAALHMAQGNYESAEPYLRAAVALRERRLPPDHPQLAQLQSDLGACLTALRHYDEAEALLVRSHTTLSTQGDSTRARETLERLVALYDAWGRSDQAAEHRRLLVTSPENPSP